MKKSINPEFIGDIKDKVSNYKLTGELQTIFDSPAFVILYRILYEDLRQEFNQELNVELEQELN